MGSAREIPSSSPDQSRSVSVSCESLLAHTGRDGRAVRPFTGLRLLDIGCGGGLIAEPLARLGASVTGLDPSPENIETATAAREKVRVWLSTISGRHERRLAAQGRRFDCVIALEVIEHVPDVSAFLQSCADVTEPGGLVVLSTLNRTAKSFALGSWQPNICWAGCLGAPISGNASLRRTNCGKAS